MIITIPIKPVAAPRQTQSDRWKQRDVTTEYRLYRDLVRYHWRKTGATFPDAGASIYFHLPWSKSWPQSKKDQMETQYHHQKPDTDNLLKALIDGLFQPNSKSKIKLPQHNGRDDASIAHYGELAKYWAKPEEARIEVYLPDNVYTDARDQLERLYRKVSKVTPKEPGDATLIVSLGRSMLKSIEILEEMEGIMKEKE